MTQGIENRRKRTNGGNDSEQDGSGAERLAAGDIEPGTCGCGDLDGQGLLHEWMVLGVPGKSGGGGPAVGATASVDGRPKGGVSDVGSATPWETVVCPSQLFGNSLRNQWFTSLSLENTRKFRRQAPERSILQKTKYLAVEEQFYPVDKIEPLRETQRPSLGFFPAKSSGFYNLP